MAEPPGISFQDGDPSRIDALLRAPLTKPLIAAVEGVRSPAAPRSRGTDVGHDGGSASKVSGPGAMGGGGAAGPADPIHSGRRRLLLTGRH